MKTYTTFYIQELSSPLHTENGKRFWDNYGQTGKNGHTPTTAESIEEARKKIKEIRLYYKKALKCSPPQLRIKMVRTIRKIKIVK